MKDFKKEFFMIPDNKRYSESRTNTDKNHIKADKVLKKTGLYLQKIEDEKERFRLDVDECVDYVGINIYTDKEVWEQDRIREDGNAKYFNDVTIRFERPDNTHSDRKLSEWHKLKLSTKKAKEQGKEFWLSYCVMADDNVVKMAQVDLIKLMEYEENGKIVVDKKPRLKSYLDNQGNLHPGLGWNYDHSSNFLTFDLNQLLVLDADLVRSQYGFKVPSRDQVSPLWKEIIANQFKTLNKEYDVDKIKTKKDAENIFRFNSHLIHEMNMNGQEIEKQSKKSHQLSH